MVTGETSPIAKAPADVRAAAHVVTKAAGGHGVVRECVELLLRAQGVWDTVYRAFVEEHGGQVQGRAADGSKIA